jgi:hypothetical protein
MSRRILKKLRGNLKKVKKNEKGEKDVFVPEYRNAPSRALRQRPVFMNEQAAPLLRLSRIIISTILLAKPLSL